jgi:hypothetical protein
MMTQNKNEQPDDNKTALVTVTYEFGSFISYAWLCLIAVFALCTLIDRVRSAAADPESLLLCLAAVLVFGKCVYLLIEE